MSSDKNPAKNSLPVTPLRDISCPGPRGLRCW